MATGMEITESDQGTSSSDEDLQMTYSSNKNLFMDSKELEHSLRNADGLPSGSASKLQEKVSVPPNIESTPRSMQLVRKILMDEHKIDEETAAAAVRSQGCDTKRCLLWIENDPSNSTLLEKSKEFKYFCGLIPHHEMKRWIVQHLISEYNVEEKLAKASVQNEGCESFSDCKEFAYSVRDSLAVIDDANTYDTEMEIEPSLENPENFQELLDSLKNTPLGGCPWDSFGITSCLKNEEKGVECLSPGDKREIVGFETMFNWLLRNQYDDAKLEELRESEQNLRYVCKKVSSGAHKCAVCKNVVHATCGDTIGEEGYGSAVRCFRCKARLEAANVSTALSDIVISEEIITEEEDLYAVSREITEPPTTQPAGTQSSCSLHSMETSVKILSEFMSNFLAKAAVLAYFDDSKSMATVHLDWCRDWETTGYQQEESSLEYSVTPKIESTPLSMQLVKKILMKEYEIPEESAGAAVRSQGCDIDLCLDWINDDPSDSTLMEKAKEFDNICGPSTVHPKNFTKLLESLENTPIWDCPWDSFGVTGRLKDTILHVEEEWLRRLPPRDKGNIIGFETMFNWLLRNQKDRTKLHALRQGSPFLHFAETSVEILCDFKSDFVAKAAVQAYFDSRSTTTTVDLDWCLNWAKANGDDEEVVEKLSSEYFDFSSALWGFERNYFLPISEMKEPIRRKIGPGGGEISLRECKITFPEQALREEQEFLVSLNNDPKNFPKEGIPITSILSCRPSITFDKPVTVRMGTCASAVGKAEVMASLYQRENENSDWVEKGNVVLTNKNLIQFDVKHFSDDVVTLSDGAGDQVDYHLINDVYMQKGTGTIASIFYVDQGSHDFYTQNAYKRDWVAILAKPKEIIARMGTEIEASLAPRLPAGIRVTTCNSPVIEITPEFIKKQGHESYFRVEDIPPGYEGNISLNYNLRVAQVEEMLPIDTTWPIVVRDQVVQGEVQENIVTMSGGVTHVH